MEKNFSTVSSNTEESCNICPLQCKSSVGRFLKNGTDLSVSLKHSDSFKNNSSIPFFESGRQKFYCILKGCVKLSNKYGAVLRICGPGDFIGYEKTKDADYYTATALGDVRACSFDRELFEVIQNESIEIAKEVRSMLEHEIEQRNERIDALEHYTVKSKVAATLLSLHKKFGVTSKFGSKINVPLDRKTLAMLSGTVIESIARTLTELENSDIIKRVGRDIHIQNVERLKQISIRDSI